MFIIETLNRVKSILLLVIYIVLKRCDDILTTRSQYIFIRTIYYILVFPPSKIYDIANHKEKQNYCKNKSKFIVFRKSVLRHDMGWLYIYKHA